MRRSANSQVALNAGVASDLDEFLPNLLRRLREKLSVISAETAHLKVIGPWEGFYGVANLVSNSTEPALSLSSS